MPCGNGINSVPRGWIPHCQLAFHGASNPSVLGTGVSVIHPPVEVNRFRWNAERDDVYLCLCRLVPYKRVDLVVEANRLGLPLLVVGDGPERARLEALAGQRSPCWAGSLSNRWKSSCPLSRILLCRSRGFRHRSGGGDGGGCSGDWTGAWRLVGHGALQRPVCEPPSSLPGAKCESLVQAVEWFEQGRVWRSLDAEAIRAWAERFRPQAFATF